MKTLRNVAIIALLALFVTAAPGGGAVAETLLTAILLGFMTAIAWLGFRLYTEHRFTLWTLPDSRRAMLYGALGMIALLFVGIEKLFATGGGVLIWLMLMGLAVFAIIRVVVEATTNRY